MSQRIVSVKSGEVYLAEIGEQIEIVLGTCVAFCVYDRVKKAGGAAHYLLPSPNFGLTPDVNNLVQELNFNIIPMEGKNLNYGTHSIKYLLSLFKKLGSSKDDLEITLVATASGTSKISDLNLDLAEKLVSEFDFKKVVIHRSKTNSVMFRFNTATGEFFIKAEPKNIAPQARRKPQLILIGASTGGTEALRSIVKGLPPLTPPILIVQHLPSNFTKALARELSFVSHIPVREAVDGEPIQPNCALIAPGGLQMKLRFEDSRYLISIEEDNNTRIFKPSVDVLYESVAKLPIAPHTRAALLTGMGSDGALGMSRLRGEGAYTLAQDEGSSLIFGMPKKAIEMGAAEEVVSLEEIPSKLLN